MLRYVGYKPQKRLGCRPIRTLHIVKYTDLVGFEEAPIQYVSFLCMIKRSYGALWLSNLYQKKVSTCPKKHKNWDADQNKFSRSWNIDQEGLRSKIWGSQRPLFVVSGSYRTLDLSNHHSINWIDPENIYLDTIFVKIWCKLTVLQPFPCFQIMAVSRCHMNQ